MKNQINDKIIKETLAKKFKDEQCYFEASDVTVVRDDEGHYLIWVKDYEHIIFKMVWGIDPVDGYEIAIYKITQSTKSLIILEDSRFSYRFEPALIELGYYIAQTF